MPRIRATPICSLLRQRQVAGHLTTWIAASLDALDLAEVARLLNHIPESHVEDREHLLGAIFRTMMLDDPIEPGTVTHLQQAAQALGIGPDWFAFLVERELGVQMDHLGALAELRLPRRYTVQDAQVAYDRMMKVYEPGRIASLGKGEAFEQAAAARRVSVDRAKQLVDARGSIPLPIWDAAEGVLRPREGAPPLVQEGVEPVERKKKETVVVRVDPDEPPPEMSEAARLLAMRGALEIKETTKEGEEEEIRAEYDEEVSTTPTRSPLLVWGLRIAFLVGASVAVLQLDPGLEGTQRFLRKVQSHVEATLVAHGYMEERLPPELTQEDPALRSAYLESLKADVDATDTLRKAVRGDEDAGVRRTAYDLLAGRWKEGTGDASEHERIITTLMWSEDEDIRSEAQALMRAEATSLSSVAKLMDHDELERRKEGLNITLEVANRLEAKEEWLAELRYRAKLESDEDLLATIERLIKDITHEEGEVDGVRTRRRLGN